MVHSYTLARYTAPKCEIKTREISTDSVKSYRAVSQNELRGTSNASDAAGIPSTASSADLVAANCRTLNYSSSEIPDSASQSAGRILRDCAGFDYEILPTRDTPACIETFVPDYSASDDADFSFRAYVNAATISCGIRSEY
jgi:hypothetical protein